MSHNEHVIDGVNKDVPFFMTIQAAKEYYLSLTQGWKPVYPDPVVTVHDGVRVVRDDLIIGTKARGGDLLMSRIVEDHLVYCQPRMGLAGVSMLDAAKHHNKKITLFMPAARTISQNQACCIERGAQVFFERIAAMPVLNKIAADWAKENKAFYIPAGLKHELVTAAIIYTASLIDPPDEVYVAISTGVLSRALQIAWPKAKFHCVAVTRNLKAGELGRAQVTSEPLPFIQSEREQNLPPFPSVTTYDAKVWKYIPKNTGRNILFWNVGTEPVLQDQSLYGRIDSWKEWKKDESPSSNPIYTVI